MAKLNLDAQEALNAIKGLIAEVNNLKTAMKNISTSNASDFDKMENNFNNLKSKVGLLTNKLRHLEAVVKKATTAVNSNTASTNKNTKSKTNQASATKKATKNTEANTQANKKSTASFKQLNTSVVALLSTFGIVAGIQIFKDIIKEVFETTKTFDSLNFALEKITGSNFAAADSQRFLLDITRKYGTELVTTTNRWIKFLAAAKQSGLSLKDSEKIFRSMTKAAGVLGLKTDELTGIYLALEQMLSKGKVTTEELRRQLGERLPGAMGIMAAAIGVTIPKLDEMLKKGEVLSADVLPKFADAVELAYDIKNVEKIETLIAAQNRLTAAWQLFVKNVSEGDSVVRKFFAFFIDLSTDTVEGWTKVLATEAQLIEEEILKEQNKLLKNLDESFSNRLAIEQDFLNKEEALTKAAAQAKRDIDRALTDEEKNEAEERYGKLIQDLKDFNIDKEELIKQFARENIEQARNEYDLALKLQKEFNAKRKILDKEGSSVEDPLTGLKSGRSVSDIFGDTNFLGVVVENEEDITNALARINDEVIKTTSKWAVYKKLLGESQVVVPDDETVAKTQRNLRTIQDLSLEIANGILKNRLDVNEDILDNEKSSISDRKALLIDSQNISIAIAENEKNIKLRNLEAQYKSEEESLKQSLNNGRLSRAKFNEFVIASELEKSQKIQIIN
jgi:tape measure domain-containing protein